MVMIDSSIETARETIRYLQIRQFMSRNLFVFFIMFTVISLSGLLRRLFCLFIEGYGMTAQNYICK